MNRIKLHVLEDVLPEVPQGSLLSLIGPSGSGKTVFILQSIYLAKDDGSLLFLLDQNPKVVEWYAECFHWNLGKLQREGKLHMYALRDLSRFRPENIKEFGKKLEELVVSEDISRVFFDTFSAVFHVIDTTFALRELLFALMDVADDTGATFFLTLHPNDPHLDLIKTLSDVVIEFNIRRELGLGERELRIVKAHGIEHPVETINYSITSEGFVVEQ